ncbi:MAG: hypothetical protein KDB71_06440 [Mycobacterium sp.]|nr:hypothetical protein [Mycobacterium sp.]
MTTATNPTDNSSRWFTRAVAAALLACGPALLALGASPESFADTGGSKTGRATATHSTAHDSPGRALPAATRVPTGAVKHHHLHYLRAGNPAIK